MTARFVESVPSWTAQWIENFWFSKRFKGRARARAARSQKHRGEGRFVYDFVDGVGGDFDFGIDYHECAVWSFLQRQQAPELAPFVCALDQLYSKRFGWGLKRTTTLAEGGPQCDFRFRRGAPTEIASTVLPVGRF